MQENPNKTKEKSLDSFGRIGTFQWVATNPNKKIFSPPQARRRMSRAYFVSFSRGEALTREMARRLFDDIARISAFLKKLRSGFSWPPSGPAEFHRHRALAIACSNLGVVRLGETGIPRRLTLQAQFARSLFKQGKTVVSNSRKATKRCFRILPSNTTAGLLHFPRPRS
jgi:hypothetical protein